MTKKDHTSKNRRPATATLSGIIGLLEHADGQLQFDADGRPCKKISESIYQCLSESSCRYKFPYENIRLCSWPKADSPQRTPDTIPCTSTTTPADSKK